ncbi:MAG TPA: ABC transporter permease [Actinomycetes bacterium]
MSGWRAALRVARREARRARGRSLLVVAMIAMPVAALAFAATIQDTFELSPDEQAGRQMGTAQAAVTWPSDGPVHQEPDRLESIPVGPPARAGRPTVERLLALLPPGTRAVADQTGRLTVRTATGTGELRARMVDYGDPLARGLLRRRSGRAPSAADEVALTPAATSRLGAGVGGTVRLADGSRSFRVVGVVEDPTDLRATTLVLRPGALPPAALSQDPHDLKWLVATPGPLNWAQVKQLNTHGVTVLSRYVLAHPPGAAERYPEFQSGDEPLGVAVLVGGMAMLEIVLLAGPAFAVGARRRRRDLALVAAAGGSPAQLRRIVLADGVVLGAAAATAGVVLGVAAAAAARPLLELHAAHFRSGGLRVFPVALAGLAGLAVVTGVLAAVVPAWIASRQDVVTALAGRRGITRSRRRWPALGAVLVVAGAGVAGVAARRVEAELILAGLALAELGLVLCTPAFVGLVARAGRWLPLAPRIALRDTSRNRTAAAPAISAVMAAVVASLAVAVVLTAEDRRARDDYRSSSRPGDLVVYGLGGPRALPADLNATLRGTMPVEQVHQVAVTTCDGQPCFVTPQQPAARQCPYLPRDRLTAAQQRAARRDPRCDGAGIQYQYVGGLMTSTRGATLAVDPAAAGAVAGLTSADADQVAAALRAGKVVVDDPATLRDGQVTLSLAIGFKGGGAREQRTVTAPGFALPHRPSAPVTLMTTHTARSLGLAPTPFATLATTSRMPTVAEEDRLRAALSPGFDVRVERGPQTNTTALLVLTVVAGVIALGAAAIATALAAADGRADLGTLAAVGASPRVRRMLSLSQAGVIAGLGSLLGVVAGLGASTAVLAALNRGFANVWPAPTTYRIAVPWPNVGVALLVVPLVAMLGAGLLTRSRLPIERRL